MVDKEKKLSELRVSDLELILSNSQKTIIEEVCQSMFEIRDLDDAKKTRERMYFIDDIRENKRLYKASFIGKMGEYTGVAFVLGLIAFVSDKIK